MFKVMETHFNFYWDNIIEFFKTYPDGIIKFG